MFSLIWIKQLSVSENNHFYYYYSQIDLNFNAAVLPNDVTDSPTYLEKIRLFLLDKLPYYELLINFLTSY